MPAALAISTCWNSGRHTDGRAMIEELVSLGFDRIELGHGIRFSLWPGVLQAVDAGLVRITSLHNFCPLPMGFTRANPNCYEFTDPRPVRRRNALRHTKETIDAAAAVGADRVVLHLGSTGQSESTPGLENLLARGRWGSRPFVRRKIRALMDHEARAQDRWPWVREALHEIGGHARAKGIRLGLECRECVEEFPLDHEWDAVFASLESFGDTFGYWHDFGHAARKDALGWIDHLAHFRRLAPRLIGCHVHDFQRPAQDHRALGEGLIPFSQFWPEVHTNPVFVLELSPRIGVQQVQACLTWWNANGPASTGASGLKSS
jgi:sugar phosphate isomerase/epimerase